MKISKIAITHSSQKIEWQKCRVLQRSRTFIRHLERNVNIIGSVQCAAMEGIDLTHMQTHAGNIIFSRLTSSYIVPDSFRKKTRGIFRCIPAVGWER